ncbi:MAG: DEAD/DEAH box helicase, partial [Betaproteobacteria bacterium]|nr:DEAD/DEAH box helicase [Betaproteobacteria bacterium]
ELLAQQLGLQRARRRRATRAAPTMLAMTERLDEALSHLPFALTEAQSRVLREINADLQRPIPMHRLLQGDVGSGKTVIALLAALQAIACGYQVALLAPTEILAEQHAAKCLPLLQKLGLRSARLSGGLKASAKRQLREAIAAQELDLVIGTHALLEASIHFANLGLAIVDEQHRFGVNQRLSLRHKREDGLEPHLLMMSATPIPRTLAMSYLADLDVSVIDELPPGRSPIRTRLLKASKRMELMQMIRQEVEALHQVYWVCPLIEESEVLDLRHAEESFEQLTQALVGIKVGLVHGRLTADEKQSVMQAFQSGEVKVLVATTVIEVGVDVPQPVLKQLVLQHFGVGEIAVVGQHDAVGRVDVEGLGFGGRAFAGGGVAHVPHAHQAFQLQHVAGVEDVAHEAFRFTQVEPSVLAGHDAGRVLPAVLEHRQRVVNCLIDR